MSNISPHPAHQSARAPLQALARRGAHFVLAGQDKKATSKGWQKNPPPLKAVTAHAAAGGLVGVIPWLLGCVCIDVDDGGTDGFEAVKNLLGDPITSIATQREGGFHLWYRAGTPEANRKWRIGKAAGDIRGGRGYAILWDPAKLAGGLAECWDDVDSADLSRLPRPPRKAPGPEAVRAAPEGCRNDTLNREAFKAASRGDYDEAAFRRAARDAGLSSPEIDATLASARTAGTMTPNFPEKNANALERAMAVLGVSLRYNTRRQLVELRDGSQGWHEMNDRREAALRRRIAEGFRYVDSRRETRPLHYSGELWAFYTNAILYEHECDPFKEWLEDLPAWDGVERVREWLGDCFDVDPEADLALTAWASQFVFLGPVWRTFEPGTKLDEMPILSGPQGIGKSTAFRLALPPELPDLFADGLHLAAAPKERAEALQGRAIVEAAEMAGKDRAELESLKAFLSRTDDGAIRLAYRRNPESCPRRCIIVGTTNAHDPLPNDPTGLRRFVVVRLTEGDVRKLTEYLNTNRLQLWAEALALYRKGLEAWLPHDLAVAQAAVNETARRRDDILEDLLEAWLAGGHDGFTLREAALGVGFISSHDDTGVSLPQREQKRLAAALTARGFARKRERREGRPEYIWRAVQGSGNTYAGVFFSIPTA